MHGRLSCAAHGVYFQPAPRLTHTIHGVGLGSDQDARGTGSALGGDVVLDCGPGPVGEIRVEFDCDAITIYSCKDLSNVVLEYENGERERFEGLSGQRGAFAGTGDNGDARIVRVWVKAGANFSGDGPGYGRGQRWRYARSMCRPRSRHLL